MTANLAKSNQQSIAKHQLEGLSVAEKVLIEGDLSVLSSDERVLYYNQVCETTGLNPLTRPFLYVSLNGKLVLYPKKDCAEQLRKVHGIRLTRPQIDFTDGLCIVTIDAIDRSGKTDSDVGIVAIGHLQGEAKANAIMKATTKAKRRVTFSICGLGFLPDLDEEQARTIESKYKETDTWKRVEEYFQKADTEEKIQKCEEWAYKKVESGKLPAMSRVAIEREALIAREKITNLYAGAIDATFSVPVSEQDSTEVEVEAELEPEITPNMLKRLYGIGKEHGWHKDELKALAQAEFSVESLKQLSRGEYDRLCDELLQNPDLKQTYQLIPGSEVTIADDDDF